MNNRGLHIPPFRFMREKGQFRVPRKALVDTAKKLIEGEKLNKKQKINVILCNKRTIRELNKKYRSKDKITDVLSFSFNDNDLLGEIYICPLLASAQAGDYGLSYEKEMQRLLVHGIFHLLGFDHSITNDKKIMEQKESRYCCLGER